MHICPVKEGDYKMNNYSWLQQRLHKFALSSQFMREVTFDVENSFIPKINNQDNHVFVAGLARSGTTILLNAIYESDEFASLSYADMPFILAPNLWSKLSMNTRHTESVERAHGDGVNVSSDSPEAFEEVFWKTFDQDSKETRFKFEEYINLILKKSEKLRYLSKNNQNIRRLKLLKEIFPNSFILIPFREPIQHTYSLLTQHRKFRKEAEIDRFIGNYMELIGHHEFGMGYKPIISLDLQHSNNMALNHWLEQWNLTYMRVLELALEEKNILLVCYESLCNDKSVWKSIKKQLNIAKDNEYLFKESIKEISTDYDVGLLNKCNELYNSLKQYSIN